MKKINLLLLSLFVTLLPTLTHAAVQLYQVEIIIFRDTNTSITNSEVWPTHPAIPNIRHAKQLQEPATGNDPAYQLLPARFFHLNNEAWGLTHKLHYPILLHIAWQQPLLSPMASKAVAISNVDNQNMGTVEGTVKLSKAGLINFKVNLLLKFNNHFGQPQVYQLKETRRLRPKEIHYFDHPAFGMLVEVTPLQ